MTFTFPLLSLPTFSSAVLVNKYYMEHSCALHKYVSYNDISRVENLFGQNDTIVYRSLYILIFCDVYMQIHVHVSMQICAHMCIGQKITLGAIFQVLFTLFFETVSLKQCFLFAWSSLIRLNYLTNRPCLLWPWAAHIRLSTQTYTHAHFFFAPNCFGTGDMLFLCPKCLHVY